MPADKLHSALLYIVSVWVRGFEVEDAPSAESELHEIGRILDTVVADARPKQEAAQMRQVMAALSELYAAAVPPGRSG